MFQLAVYGKGGIGKSTMSANISLMLAQRGHRVMQIGCDPKHDSTRLLLGGGSQRTVLDYVRDVPECDRRLEDVMVEGSEGVFCIESGGPEPGIGCAGRGILTAFETIGRLGADRTGADVRLYDVLGDVVCGGFAVPLREENADGVIIVTSGEFMALYAANNIMKGIRRFTPERPRLIGIVLNSRGVEGEKETVARFAAATGTRVIATVPRDRLFASAEAAGHTVCELFPDSPSADAIRRIVDRVEAVMAGDVMDIPHPLDDDQLSDLAAGREIRPSARIPTDVPVCSGCGHYPSSRQKYSCASCGAVMALARLRDTAVVIHGPRSCAYLMDSAYLSTVADLYTGGVYDDSMPDNLYSTCMDDNSAIFGGAERLRDILDRAGSDGFREMAVVTTCVSGMIGDDCDAVARDYEAAHPDTRVTVIHTDGVIGGDYTDGMESVVSELIDSMDPDTVPVPGTVNLVGASFFDLQSPEAAGELSRMLSVFGLRVNCRFLDDTAMGSVRGFGTGSMDIILNELRAEDYEDAICARFGTVRPVVRLPTGLDEYIGWLRRMSDAAHIPCDEEERSARKAHEDFVRSHRSVFEGKRVILSTTISRRMDWLVDILIEMGAEVVRFGFTKGADERCGVTALHKDMLTYDYGKREMSRDWDELHPDLLMYDVDIPDGYPGRSIRIARIGPGVMLPLRFMESVSEALSTETGRGCGQ